MLYQPRITNSLDGAYPSSAILTRERTENKRYEEVTVVRRSTLTSVTAETLFPVRVRVPVPPRGLGLRLNEMHDWLREHAPNGGHWVGSQHHGLSDAALVYFGDIKVAHEFCEAFKCGRIESE